MNLTHSRPFVIPDSRQHPETYRRQRPALWLPSSGGDLLARSGGDLLVRSGGGARRGHGAMAGGGGPNTAPASGQDSVPDGGQGLVPDGGQIRRSTAMAGLHSWAWMRAWLHRSENLHDHTFLFPPTNLYSTMNNFANSSLPSSMSGHGFCIR